MRSMSTRKTFTSLTALLALSAFALSACGDDESDAKDDSTPESSQSVTESSEATESTEATESGEASEGSDAGSATDPEAGDVTAPGTELAIGDPAVVPFSSGDGSGVLEVKVTAIEKGSVADLKPLKLGDRAKGYVPYYIQVSVTGVSGSDSLSNYSVNESIDGLLPDGSKAQSISIIGDFAPCDGETIPGDFADGQTFTTCVPWLAQESSEVNAAQYAQDGDYDSYDGKPVVWK